MPQTLEVRPERKGNVDQRGPGWAFFLKVLRGWQLLPPEGRGEGKGKPVFCHLVTFLPPAHISSLCSCSLEAKRPQTQPTLKTNRNLPW